MVLVVGGRQTAKIRSVKGLHEVDGVVVWAHPTAKTEFVKMGEILFVIKTDGGKSVLVRF